MTTEAVDKPNVNLLERAVGKIARGSSGSKKLAQRHVSAARSKNPRANELDIKIKAAKAIVRTHALRSGVSGGVTGMAGIIPGPGTVVAITGGALTDIALYMKANVDMCHAMVYVFNADMPEEDAYRLAMLLAAHGSLERKGAAFLGQRGAKLASDAGVRILRQQLKGTALIAVKQAFKRVGIVFTRKAVEKAIPFGVGAVIGGTVNAGMTTYVGHQARKWLELNETIP